MTPRKAPKAPEQVTTAQRLRAVVKSCRDIMRKDKGLNGDLDRLPIPEVPRRHRACPPGRGRAGRKAVPIHDRGTLPLA